MIYQETEIPGVWLIEPNIYEDERGYFMETFKQEEFNTYIGNINFIQLNESCSSKDVIRGLHYQLAPWSQAKLVRVIQGTVLDVAVDLRKESPTFGKSVTIELSGENKKQLFIPRGFAHGFRVLSDKAVFTYMVDNVYMPAYERCIYFNDPTIAVNWQIQANDNSPVLSEKDKHAPSLQEAEHNFFI
ncbi:MAG: dTDP-4-dehydrorhamnose 3,5-epimerase [Tannerellaceae bacterium]|nr:dTDP-4-dehydrorhamnose 3,5-epimerase [Tannerellaceae bacterium]